MAGMDMSGMNDEFGNFSPNKMLESMGHGKPGGPAMPEFLDIAEFLTRSKVATEKLFEAWCNLTAIIERNELVIQKRWLKKTAKARKELLLKAWPEMAMNHRPDLQHIRGKSAKHPSTTKQAAYMWPYINLEDLSKPKALLILLNSRGRNHPLSFARADFAATHIGRTTGVVLPIFLNDYTVLLYAAASPEGYWQVVSWAENAEACGWAANKKGFMTGEALLIFQLQARIYEFLVDCSKLILHDILDPADISLMIQPEPPVLSTNDIGLQSVAVLASEAPYRLPANINLETLHSTVLASLAASEDHIWTLREDPGYYAENVQTARDHCKELLTDENGKRHPILDPSRVHKLLYRCEGSAVIDPYFMLEVWGKLDEQLTELKRLAAKYEGTFTIMDDLPKEYAMAFYKLRFHLDEFASIAIASLNISFSSSPPMRQYICLEFSPDVRDDKVIDHPSNPITSPGVRELHWLMNGWLFDKEQLQFVKMENVVDELQRLIEADRDAANHVSSTVERHIADLGVISQCIRQIDLYQPWAAGFQQAMWRPELEKELQKDYSRINHVFGTYAVKGASLFTGKLGQLGDPSDGKFTYPVNRGKNETNNNAMRLAEANLDAFWVAADRAMSPFLTKRLQKLLATRLLQRTPEWTPQAKDSSQDKSIVDVLTQQYQRSEKAKTRGTANPTKSTQASKVTKTPKPERTFEVDKRALKVFRTLFYTPSTNSQPGEISWADFLHAMISTGFTSEKLYGSVWQFTPTLLDVESSIHFHEPHPSPKLPFTWSRRIGRRLSRNYGLHGELFSLAE